MDELTRRLRKASPYRAGTVPESGERSLRLIKSGERSSRTLNGYAPSSTVRRPGFMLLSGAAIVSVFLAIIMVVVLDRPTAAMAGVPAPLTLQPASLTLEEMREELHMALGEQGDNDSHPGYSIEGWYYQFDREHPRKHFIQPQRVEALANKDGSGITRVYAGTPVSLNNQVLTSAPTGAVRPGTLIEETTWGVGELLASFPTPPPNTTNEMRTYLAAYLSQGTEGDTSFAAADYEIAAVSLLQTWTLSERAQRALINVIVQSDGVGVAGSALDRLGREGLVLEFSPGRVQGFATREQLVIDTKNWRILAAETINVDGDPEYFLAPGSVISYTLWRHQ